MLRITLALLVLLSIACSSTQVHKPSTLQSQIFLVRHAEKADDGSRNPPLTSIGEQRAISLATLLRKEHITHIYSTDYLRTKHTAQPLADALGLEVLIYDPRNLSQFADQVLQLRGQNILIVGHSNSTPTLANAILDKEEYQKFDESAYSNLIVISVDDDRKTSELRSF